MNVYQFVYGADNYGYLLHCERSGETACIDAGSADARAELAALAQTGWSLSHIFITHHHADHTAGLAALKAATGARVYGPARARSKRAIPGLDVELADGAWVPFGDNQIEVIETPGHTLDMLNYYIADQGIVFTGDTLFAAGCGRVFEGTFAQMFTSLERLRTLPARTRVYCGHEYTLANIDFALSVDADNPALTKRAAAVTALRADNKPSVPSTIAEELATNPYFRVHTPEIIGALGMPQDAAPADVFAELRQRKDRF